MMIVAWMCVFLPWGVLGGVGRCEGKGRTIMVSIQERLSVTWIVYAVVPIAKTLCEKFINLLVHKLFWATCCLVGLATKTLKAGLNFMEKLSSLLQKPEDEGLDIIWAKTAALQWHLKIVLVTLQRFKGTTSFNVITIKPVNWRA